jgi:hypothetical protein
MPMEISLSRIGGIVAALVCLLAGAGAATGAEGELTGTLKKINDTDSG